VVVVVVGEVRVGEVVEVVESEEGERERGWRGEERSWG
jgi:hypothetical protein